MAIRLALAAFLLSLLPGFIFAQANHYSLKGKVFADNGDPLYEAQVTVFSPISSGEILAQAYTDSSGQYELSFSSDVSTGIAPSPIPQGFALGQAYPNPVTAKDARLRIPYSQPENIKSAPELQLFDVLGRRIQPNTVLAAGTYFYRLRFANGTVSAARRFVSQTGKLVFELQRQAAREGGALGKALSPQTAFPAAIEYPGYY
ncbi:MAG: T9SS C-terminal target domain-containing protein, partial [Calditrichaeota bacterium]